MSVDLYKRMNMTVSVDIECLADAHTAVQACTALCKQIGFARKHVAEIAIVVSELCTNIARHGVRGRLEARAVEHQRHGHGIELRASDEGPDFVDFVQAQQDGWTDAGPIDPLDMPKRRGLGSGLGAIARLTDEFVCVPRSGSGGKVLRATRYCKSS